MPASTAKKESGLHITRFKKNITQIQRVTQTHLFYLQDLKKIIIPVLS